MNLVIIPIVAFSLAGIFTIAAFIVTIATAREESERARERQRALRQIAKH
jgi:hypothetical protein